jgi:tartrate-resistant acid phosphatase type 5
VKEILSDSLRFVAVGDWGGQPKPPYTTPIQLQVAAQMGNTAQDFGSQFTLGIGDNFYDKGIRTNEDDIRFNATFESVYTHPSLQSRWYIVAGNHDHLGNVTAQIRYTTHSDRWYFPTDWYDVKMVIPGTNVTVQWLFIDTVVFVEWFNKEADKEYKWVKDTLRDSTADWIFVCGHYPVWSIGSH